MRPLIRWLQQRVDSDGPVFLSSRYEQKYNRGAATQYVLPAHPRPSTERSIRDVLFRIITLPYQSASDLFTANANKWRDLHLQSHFTEGFFSRRGAWTRGVILCGLCVFGKRAGKTLGYLTIPLSGNFGGYPASFALTLFLYKTDGPWVHSKTPCSLKLEQDVCYSIST